MVASHEIGKNMIPLSARNLALTNSIDLEIVDEWFRIMRNLMAWVLNREPGVTVDSPQAGNPPWDPKCADMSDPARRKQFETAEPQLQPHV